MLTHADVCIGGCRFIFVEPGTQLPQEAANRLPTAESADEKKKARDYGHSFGSKKVEMAPGFVNLRFMCHCLAKAIKRHLEFGKNHWFLQDL